MRLPVKKKGTILAALALGKRTAVLTLIGGGVFENPIATLRDAILWAIDEAGRHARAPLDVIVNGRESVRREDALAAVRSRGGVVVEAGERGIAVSR